MANLFTIVSSSASRHKFRKMVGYVFAWTEQLLSLGSEDLGNLGCLAVRGGGLTPRLHGLVVLGVEVGLAQLLEGIKVSLVLWLHFSDGEAGGGLLANKGTQAGLGLDNAVGDATGLAQGWKPHNDLNWVDIVGDHNQLGLLLLDKLGHMVDSHLDTHRLLGGSVSAGSLGLCGVSEALGLLGLALWLELVEQTEELASLALVESALELVDCWGQLEALVQNAAGALQTDVLGPLDEAGQVTTGADVATNGEDARLLLDHVSWELGLDRSLLDRKSVV